MAQSSPPYADLKFWVSAFALLVSVWSAVNSWRSRRLAARALRISENQEQRRQPLLGIYMANGYRRFMLHQQLFGFLVSVSNPTDINNCVAQVELQLTYLLDNDIKAVCRIPHNPTLVEIASGADGHSANVFTLPIRIDAHQTAAGWLVFSLGNDVIAGRTIDAYRIILEDSHGASTTTEPILVKDWSDEASTN